MNSQNASDEDFPSFMEKSRAIHKELQEVLKKHDARIACCVLVSYLKQYSKVQPDPQLAIEAMIEILRYNEQAHD